jgi:hypothetical protein
VAVPTAIHSVPAVLRLGNGGGGIGSGRPRSISSISGTGNHREPLQVDNGDDRIAGCTAIRDKRSG